MPIRKQPLPLQFSGGVDTKSDSKQVAATQLLDLQNATFIKASTLSKRNGYTALGNTVEGTLATLSSPQGVGVRGTELVKFDGAKGFSYLPNTDRWSAIGDVMSVTATSDPVARTGAYQQQPDVATNNGVTVVAWEDGIGGIWYSLLEAASKRVIVQPTVIVSSGAERPRCLAVGQVLHVLYAVPASSLIWVLVINPAIPTATVTPQVLVSELSPSTPLYDACVTNYNSDNPALIAWVAPGGAGFTYEVGFIHPSGVLGSPLTNLPSVVTGTQAVSTSIGCAFYRAGPGSSDPVCVMGTDTAAPWYQFFKGNMTADTGGVIPGIFGAGARRIALEYGSSTLPGRNVWWALDTGAADDDQNSVRIGNVTSFGVTQVNTAVQAHGLVSRAWLVSGDVYVAIQHTVKFFSYVAVVKLAITATSSALTVCARVLTGQSPGLPARTHLPSVFLDGAHAFVPLLYRLQLQSANGDKFSEIGIRLYDFDFADSSAWQSVQFGRGLYIAGACMQHYDGDRIAEADFHCAPDTAAGGVPQPVKAVGGSMTSSVTYGYQFVYEEVDGQGELHRGAASSQVNVVMGATDTQTTWAIPTLHLTSKRRVRIGVYRSLANDNSKFFRCSSIDITATAGANAYLLNDPTLPTLTFLDRMSDATLALLEPMYTNGGVLSNDPPAFGGGIIATGGNRVFFNDPDDPSLIRYSQQRADETAIELVNALSFRLDPYGGPLVAIGVMDAAVFGFCETAIYGVVGAGPDVTGSSQNTSFSPPQLVTSDVGCKSPGSICQTPIGIMFQSSKGIMLLGRDRQVQYVGAKVEAYNDETIVRATLLPDRCAVLFLANSGRSLYYDYEFQQWSTFTNHVGLDAVVVDGVYHYLRTDGRVFQETPGVFRDDNAHIPMLIETAWIKMAGYLQGWQKILWVYWLGKYLSPHDLWMRYRIDYRDAYSPAFVLPVTSDYLPDLYGAGTYGSGSYGGDGGPNTVYQRRVHLNRRCQAVSFQVYDVESVDNFGAAFELSELLLIGGVLGPDFKVGAARSG